MTNGNQDIRYRGRLRGNFIVHHDKFFRSIRVTYTRDPAESRVRLCVNDETHKAKKTLLGLRNNGPEVNRIV